MVVVVVVFVWDAFVDSADVFVNDDNDNDNVMT